MGDEISITVIATGFDASKKRETPRATTPVAETAGAANGRDYMRDLQNERAAAVPVGADAAAAGQQSQLPGMREAYPTAQPQAQQDPARRPVPEVEDLDIPAFLRRNQGN